VLLRSLMALRDQLLVLQEIDAQIDHLHEELRLASLLGDAKTAHLDSEIARARRDEDATRARLEQRRRQRAEAAAAIPARLREHYQRLRQRRRSHPWVVGLPGSSCPACSFSLPSKLAADARRTGEPIACPSCARLLVGLPAAPTT
jgi:predicted  nucleic acid-binding Zn-ribbon protein